MTDLKIGDEVSTRFKGWQTFHTVIDAEPEPKTACQSGLLVKVTPALSGDLWIDSDWFIKHPTEQKDGEP